ncbi:MAG: flagellar hook protein FlgE [Gammaproteobacteria bacterium]|nr:flagellar hook protein FlgE [Gammaproteobacteria bacterium]NNC68648.1 flagellar hook protein FlgE [Gammaproteobacteria bacterium]
MPFDIALTGLNAAQNDLQVISNNIANSETNGFKRSRAEFADLYATSQFGTSSNAIGQGVEVASISQQFTDGDITFTDNSLDLAISGGGFFVLSDGGAQTFSRAGAFQVDNLGNIVNSSGSQLVGFQADSSGNLTGAQGPLVISRGNIAPNVTSTINIDANIDASEIVLPAFLIGPSGAPDPGTYNHATSYTVFDSLGGEHVTTNYFRKDNATDWQVFQFVDNTQISGPDVLTFDAFGDLTAINGTVGQTTTTSGAFTPGGIGAPTTFTVDYSGVTQFGGGFGISAIDQNGFATGRLSSLDFDPSGALFARYTNGQSLTLGQVALANFANPQGLRPTGSTAWSESFASGQPLIGAPGSADLGLVQSGSLEESNVDVTGELINLIQTQRNFQANAQVIGTADTITQTIINIR